MMVCPKCGDWLPLALGEYTCAGPGHHVAVRPYSVIPIVPPTPNDVDRTYRLAVQNALYTLLFILTILGALFLFGMCRKAGAL
jgi:hypothetical protein